jgi:DNA-binding phage protein
MYIIKKYFPEVMADNEMAYFNHLFGVIESVDELCSMEITKKPTAYHFRIATSVPKYNETLLQEILKLHNLFNIRLNLSKSIKTSATIVFDIELN